MVGSSLFDVWQERVFSEYLHGRPSLSFPRLVVIGAQSGAGKSSVSSYLMAAFEQANAPAVHSDIDNVRLLHPDITAITDAEPFRMSDITNKPSFFIQDSLMRTARSTMNNVIYEGTLNRFKDVGKLVAEFKRAGYAADLHILAVNEKTSVLGIYQRFERAVATGKTPRWVPISYHDRIYPKLPFATRYLERTGYFDFVKVYLRNADVLSDNTAPFGIMASKIAIMAERNRAWLPFEREEHHSAWKDVYKLLAERSPLPTEAPEHLAQARAFFQEAALLKHSSPIANDARQDNLVPVRETPHHVFMRPQNSMQLVDFPKRAGVKARVYGL